MSFFDDASLVMIPSGYKDQKVYSVKPTDGTGDLTFSRASGATRVASNGLIEKVRSNRFTYSQALANAAWLTTTDGGTITKTANAGTAPDGTNTATRIQIGGGGTYSLVYQNGVNPLGLVVISGYFKRYGSTNQTFRLFGDNGSALSASLTATDTWQRFSYVMNATSTGADGIAADASNNAYDILVWGMQIETGDIATAYIPTTTAAVSVGPVSGLPRLDYLGSSCPRLLLEPQRTNLLTYSEQIDNAAWTKPGSSASANQAVSPDGYTNGDKLLPNNGISITIASGGVFTAGASAYIRSGALTLTAASYTFSIFVKKAELDYVQLRVATSVDLVNDGSGNLVNLNNGASSSANSVQDYGNGWYRVSHTFTATAATWYVGIWFWNSTSLTANGSQGILGYGAQLELGTYATSYIPTLGASVTRVADAASKTSATALIGQTEGTIYWEVQKDAILSNCRFQLSDGTSNNWLFVSVEEASLAIRIYAGVLSGTTVDVTSVATLNNNAHKIAFAYATNDFKVYVDGVEFLTHTSGNIPACSRLEIGNNSPTGAVLATSNTSQALLFKTRLTNAQLAELTTL
jgi:hypothetical protein